MKRFTVGWPLHAGLGSRDADGTDFPLRPPRARAGALLLALVPGPAGILPARPQEGLETRIERSGRLELDGLPRPTADGRAVLEVVGDDITVELTGRLRGALAETPPDRFTGVGIRVTGQRVTLRGARVSGFRVGIHALEASGLVLEDCDVSDNFRQRLASTVEKEAAEDWLSPHDNDAHEWFERYGAGLYIERSRDVTVRGSRARRTQNGLILDRVIGAQVHDNDFSFLSGWGIALWRSSHNVIARNACDFCVRGYVHGVYNRGQDSAGILLFEQSSDNVVAENSATHCGDGFFCFAGQEALGVREPLPEGFDATGKGCNSNLIVGNDFSFAAAHGLELTFSFDNAITRNRFEGNAICGIWGGYSRRTRITDNDFLRNGDAGYGLERGGIDIEHGQQNRIEGNRFVQNTCGVHLWWDEDAHLAQSPWGLANGHESKDERVLDNVFTGDEIGIQLRGPTDVRLLGNRFEGVKQELWTTPDAVTTPAGLGRPREAVPALSLPQLPGRTRPVGARKRLAGREHIRIDEWGPVEPDA